MKMKQINLIDPEQEEAPVKVEHKTLRHATLNDIPYCIELAKKLAKGSPIEAIDINVKKVREKLEAFIINAGRDFLCLVSYDGDKVVGVIAAYAFEPLFSDDKIACEVLWYLEPEYRKGRRGIDMMKAYEYWANMVGCKVVQYGWLASSPEGMKKLYELTGAELSEQIYYKKV